MQYQFSKSTPLKKDEYKECIKIHIPSGQKLIHRDVINSISKSKAEIKKYFNLENPSYYCSSWLISPTIKKLVDENSNVSSFYDLFDILDEKDGIDDILNFLFNVTECDDYNKLEEKTSLQRKVKKLLLNGEKITIGIGQLKNKI